MNKDLSVFVTTGVILLIIGLLITYQFPQGEVADMFPHPNSNDEGREMTTYTDELKHIEIRYPADWSISYDPGFKNESFQLIFDMEPNDRVEMHGQIYGLQVENATYPGCYYSICNVAGEKVRFASNEWTRIDPPFPPPQGGARITPTEKVYRISDQGWEYYAHFNDEEDARTVLETLRFLPRFFE